MDLSVSKYLRRWRNLTLFIFITLGLFLFTACGEKEHMEIREVQTPISSMTEENVIQAIEPLDMLTFSLPSGMDSHHNSEREITFRSNGAEVGGVFLLECDNEIFDDVLNYQDSLTPLVLNAMKRMDSAEWEWYMSSSSLYGLLEFTMGNSQKEYNAYLVRGHLTCYVVWFNRNLISSDEQIAIMESLSSEDIADELNMVSSQAYADAVAESMAREEYKFDVILPEGIEKKGQTEDGALFYQNGQLVGGYKIIHFEKGILPAVHENQELILERLKTYLINQIDMTDFHGEIIDKSLITARFSNGETEYTHYILSYGQVGTQYDIWLDATFLDQSTVGDIISGAQLTTVS